MKQAEYSNWKATFDIRKRPINGKLFQNQKTTREQFILNPKKTLGKKYMQQPNIFKQKIDQPKKQHREIVMSEQFIRSSKLYRLLRQKMDRCDSMFIKQVNVLSEHKLKLKDEIVQIKSENYQQKIGLWELKNRLMQMKTLYQEEEEESKRLGERNFVQYDGQEEGEDEIEEGEQNAEQDGNEQDNMYTQEQYIQAQKQKIGEENILELQQQKQGVEVKKEFSQILEQLMHLKAERQRIEKQFSQEQQPQQQKIEQKTNNKTQFFIIRVENITRKISPIDSPHQSFKHIYEDLIDRQDI